MPVTQINREMSPEQRKIIRSHLVEFYDTEKERYRGSGTDKSIAEMCGHGIVAGWVAQVMKNGFGDGEGNEEEEKLGDEAAAMEERIAVAENQAKTVYGALPDLQKDLSTLLQDIKTASDLVDDLKSQATAMEKRVLGLSEKAEKAVTSTADARSKITAMTNRLDKLIQAHGARAKAI